MNAPPDCSLCPRLVESRRMVVNGGGPLPSRVIIIGQNPGRTEEDQRGPMEPLIGWSGNKLVYYASLARLVDLPYQEEWDGLSKEEQVAVMTTARSTLRRENIVRCRPPPSIKGGGDEAPTAKEIKNCRPFLEELLSTHSPRYIVTLGSPAWKWFGNDNPLSSAHGQPFRYSDTTTVVPMYHPAAAAGGRKPQLAKVMENDWEYLGHVLNDEGDLYWSDYSRRSGDLMRGMGGRRD